MSSAVQKTERPEMKAYNVISAVEFLEQNFPDRVDAIRDGFTEPLKTDLTKIGSFDFVPRAYLSEVTEAIANEVEPGAPRIELLSKLGEHIAHGATNTFLRLLMRMMTPQIFAKKVGAIWKKDNRGGHVVADTTDLGSNKLLLNFSDVDGFAYFRAICIGWMGFAFRRMGAKNVRVSFPDQDANEPYDESVQIAIEWD